MNLGKKDTSVFVDLNKIPSYVYRFKGLGFPDRFRTFLEYTQLQLALISSATSGNYTFSGNSVFDPDTSGTGHQPLYFDQMVAIYNRYRVFASKLKFELLSATSSAAISITPTTDSARPTSIDIAWETPYTMEIPISSSVFRTVRHALMETQKLWGMGSVTQDDVFSAVFSANPLRQWYWKIWAVSSDGSTSMTLRCNISVTYDVEFSERISPGQS